MFTVWNQNKIDIPSCALSSVPIIIGISNDLSFHMNLLYRYRYSQYSTLLIIIFPSESDLDMPIRANTLGLDMPLEGQPTSLCKHLFLKKLFNNINSSFTLKSNSPESSHSRSRVYSCTCVCCFIACHGDCSCVPSFLSCDRTVTLSYFMVLRIASLGGGGG